MVVLVILMILMGLVIGSIFAVGPTNRLLATEHLIADFVRQARHTARSTGSPVVLQVVRDTAIGVTNVSGVSRICLWSDTFEKAIKTDVEYIFGQSGIGFARKGAILGETASAVYTIPKKDLLNRASSRSHSDGFFLSCAVRPPLAAGSVTQVPLLLIGATEDIDTSVCGLRLVPYRFTQSGRDFYSWELTGWIRKDGATSLDEVTPFASGGAGLAGAISGDRWEDVGLLFDGRHLELYRNSQVISRLDLGADVKLAAGDNIYLGQIVDNTLNGSAQLLNCTSCVDDARLYRLGTDQLGRLPNGVNADSDYTIVVQPDGRVEATDANGNATTELLFRGSALSQGNTLNAARISVTSDGRVASRLEQ